MTKDTPFDKIVLDFIVGDQTLTGYAVGFDLPLGGPAERGRDR